VRIIDNNDVGAPAGKSATKGRNEDTAAGVCAEVCYLGMTLLDLRAKDLLKPAR
jgi:hypothetical protein